MNGGERLATPSQQQAHLPWCGAVPGLVIFDCDGVLIDSEAIASRVVARSLTAAGWPMDTVTARRLFLGMTLTDMEPLIEARLGSPVEAGWRASLTADVIAAMAKEAVLVNGALDAMAGVERLGLPWRVASNSSHAELAAKFGRVGLAARVAGRVHSHHDVGRGKPAPDLFLAAAAAAGVPPARCVVVEDSIPGATAARAAGMPCLGYAPHGDGQALRDQGAHVIRSLREVPLLLARAIQLQSAAPEVDQ